MTMTVKQLKDKLATMDENLKVYAHSSLDEGGDAVYAVEVTTEFPSCQGDEPGNLPASFVIINC